MAGKIYYSVSSILITFTFHSNIKMAHTLNYTISVHHKFFHGFIFPKIHNSSPRDEWARWEKVGEASIAERSFPTKEKIFCFSSMCRKDPLTRDTHLVIINGAIICAFFVWPGKREYLSPILVLSFYHFCLTIEKKKLQNQSSLTISWGLEGFIQFHEGLWGKKTSDEASLEKLEPSGV